MLKIPIGVQFRCAKMTPTTRKTIPKPPPTMWVTALKISSPLLKFGKLLSYSFFDIKTPKAKIFKSFELRRIYNNFKHKHKECKAKTINFSLLFGLFFDIMKV